MGEQLSRNDVIRKALAVELPGIEGDPIVVKTMTVEDGSGNERTVNFMGHAATLTQGEIDVARRFVDEP